LPVTQAELGDALGLSTVHVNRTLQELRGDGLITLRGNLLKIEDWEGLKRAGEFDSTYLHLDEEHENAVG
jgi:DNA-binding transcriptional regulator LsrR (DeoR family)